MPSVITCVAATCLLAGAGSGVARASGAKLGGSCTAKEQGTITVVRTVVLVCTKTGTKRVWLKAPVATVPPVGPAQSPPGPARVVLADVFTNPDSGWPTRRSDALDIGYQGTRSYGMLVRGAQQQVGASSPVKTPLTDVTVNVQARIVPFVGGFSVGCYDTGTTDVNTNRYDALIGHDDKWVVSEFRAGVRTTLAAGDLRLGLLLNGVLPNTFSVSCSGRPGGPGTIAVTLNGQAVATVPVAAMLPPGNVSLWAFTNSTTSGTQILYDNFSVSTTA